MDLKGKKLILASNSPRRKELMAALDIKFTVDARTEFEEVYSPATPHLEVPCLMSEGKSRGFHRELAPDEVLVTSDTMVVCGSEILGKPSSREDAVKMLNLLSDREHQVVTAVTIRDSNRMKTFSVTSNVFFNKLSRKDMDYYIDTYKPYDKAGAYGIQEWIGYIGISGIEGSFYNVMGFPTHRFYQELAAFLDEA